MGYKVKLNVFEGPFDLLVYLIEHAQMNIYDIEISEITRQYLAYMEEMKRLDVPLASEFLVLAAALIEIKSKMLLPRTTPGDENVEFEDPRTDLVEKLVEYKRFKLLAEMLRRQEGAAMRILEKPQEDLSIYTGEPDEYLKLELRQFVAAFNLFLQKKKKEDELRRHHIRTEKQKVTAEARMADIQNFFLENHKAEADFRELVKRKEDKYDIALTFSSVLEMMKERRLDADQKDIYGTITVKATDRLMEKQTAAMEGSDDE